MHAYVCIHIYIYISVYIHMGWGFTEGRRGRWTSRGSSSRRFRVSGFLSRASGFEIRDLGFRSRDSGGGGGYKRATREMDESGVFISYSRLSFDDTRYAACAECTCFASIFYWSCPFVRPSIIGHAAKIIPFHICISTYRPATVGHVHFGVRGLHLVLEVELWRHQVRRMRRVHLTL